VKQHIVFLATVLVPTATATVYYGLIASGVYISESRFVVRSPQKPAQASGLLSNLLEGTGISRSQDDTYLVHDFILSRDAVKELDAKLGIRSSFSSRSTDWFNRFPHMGLGDSFEDFYRYYGKHVGVEYDTSSSISVLTVSAFGAEDAQKINQMLLDMSERLLNSLNDRSRRDLIQFAEHDVAVAEQKAQDASLALLAYRTKQAVFEPDRQAGIQLEGVAKIQEELITTEAQLAQVRKISPDNPQIPGLESRAETLRTASRTEASKVTNGSGSYSARAPEFARLALQSEFAGKQLGVALAALETARSEAARKQLYLERLVQPNLPDKAMEPRRTRSVLTVFLFGLVAWGTASLILAAIREHGE
jgi:capsular polysaccharide transport system permease protein